MSEREGARGGARGGEDLTPPSISLSDAPKELLRELVECGISIEVVKSVLDVRPRGGDKRLTAPLAIRSRRGRMAMVELYAWTKDGMFVEDMINNLNYLTGITPRTLREYWEGIKRQGRVRESDGKVRRLET